MYKIIFKDLNKKAGKKSQLFFFLIYIYFTQLLTFLIAKGRTSLWLCCQATHCKAFCIPMTLRTVPVDKSQSRYVNHVRENASIKQKVIFLDWFCTSGSSHLPHSNDRVKSAPGTGVYSKE